MGIWGVRSPVSPKVLLHGQVLEKIAQVRLSLFPFFLFPFCFPIVSLEFPCFRHVFEQNWNRVSTRAFIVIVDS